MGEADEETTRALLARRASSREEKAEPGAAASSERFGWAGNARACFNGGGCVSISSIGGRFSVECAGFRGGRGGAVGVSEMISESDERLLAASKVGELCCQPPAPPAFSRDGPSGKGERGF